MPDPTLEELKALYAETDKKLREAIQARVAAEKSEKQLGEVRASYDRLANALYDWDCLHNMKYSEWIEKMRTPLKKEDK